MTTPAHAAASPRKPRTLRWFALLLALLLHALAFQWADGLIGLPSWHKKAPEQPKVIATELKPPPEPVRPPVERTAAAPKPKPRPKRAAPPPVAQTSAPEPSATTTDTAATPMEAPAEIPPIAKAADTPPPSTAEPAKPAEEDSGSKPYKVAPPPPAELKYEVFALREGQQWHGAGAFRWESSGSSYSVTGEASITFLFKITVLNFRSEGEIREFGIAPVLYSEKPFRKSLTNTHFQHANGKISFSASEATYPYKGGEQDRGSIIWQLAGIGRGDATQFAPGAEIDVVVAGNRDADTWRIKVIGEEDLETGIGTMRAWHVSRAPRPGSYDQTIDIWFAPQREWYPVKVRYTYANGDFLDLSASSLTPLAAQ
jgi:hypothetical protein